MRNNKSSETAAKIDFNRVLSSLSMAVSFWKPIVRNEVPSKEQFEKDREETHLAIKNSEKTIEKSKNLLASLHRINP